MADPDRPPGAARVPHEHVAHGVRRADPYAWMRGLDAPVLEHLDAERAWYDVATRPLAGLTRTLAAEMTGRVPATDPSVSWQQHGYSYYTLLPADREYAHLLRRRLTASPEADEEEPDELLLDVNALVGESGYVELGLSMVSPDGRVLAWSVDREGDEVYELGFRDLAGGKDLETVPRSYYGGAWDAASTSFFYVVHDDAYRPFQVWRHVLGTAAADDVLVLEEPDERFDVMVRASRSGRLVVIWSESRDTTEVWVLDAAGPDAAPRSVGGRRHGVEYHAEHVVRSDGDVLLLVTNESETEFALAECPVPRDADQDASTWRPARAADPGERLEQVEAFADHVVLVSRTDGHHRLRVLPVDDLTGDGLVVDPASVTGDIALARNEEWTTDRVTVREESWLEPPVWSDVALTDGAREVRHRQEAPGHDPAAYLVERQVFSGVPATVIRHRDTPLDGSAPCLLYGYGAYEAVFDPEWDPAVPSLLDRGVVYVHTHLRGGGERGRAGYLEGRLEHKQHTFDDHVAVADGLAEAGLVDGARIATRGLSAGGLLQGAVLSQRPERWRAVVAEVPFVDVVTTMLDPSIPLTVNEWDEWGDPRRPEDFAWMAAYSPYDNLPRAGARPDLLVTGALHDARVMVWEPAKWVAALRESDPAWSPRCLFRVETGAGAHVGPSGRFAQLAYEAEVYAWVLAALGATDSRVSSA